MKKIIIYGNPLSNWYKNLMKEIGLDPIRNDDNIFRTERDEYPEFVYKGKPYDNDKAHIPF